MTEKSKKRPRDPIQLAKLIGDIATGQVQDVEDDGKNAAKSCLMPLFNHKFVTLMS